jgi:hypothetical protein
MIDLSFDIAPVHFDMMSEHEKGKYAGRKQKLQRAEELD